MFFFILQDLEVCLIAQEKQRNFTKRFEWMEIFLQNFVQIDYEKIPKDANPTNQTTIKGKIPKGLNPPKIIFNSFESKEPLGIPLQTTYKCIYNSLLFSYVVRSEIFKKTYLGTEVVSCNCNPFFFLRGNCNLLHRRNYGTLVDQQIRLLQQRYHNFNP